MQYNRDMDQSSLEARLSDLHLPAIRYYESIDSTNDEAWRWVEAGGLHTALVIADEQTSGRGRLQRRWVTTGGSGLAFSIILRSPPLNPLTISRLTGLGALAGCAAIRQQLGMQAEIKWPNDILVNQKKAGGVLAETHWEGEKLIAAVVGIGINVASDSISPELLPPAGLNFPATCLELELGRPVQRLELLYGILKELISWIPRLGGDDLITQWESWLAYRGQWVELLNDAESTVISPMYTQPATQAGKLVGLARDGSLKLLTRSGELVIAQAGELHLRPATP